MYENGTVLSLCTFFYMAAICGVKLSACTPLPAEKLAFQHKYIEYMIMVDFVHSNSNYIILFGAYTMSIYVTGRNGLNQHCFTEFLLSVLLVPFEIVS